jgi:hypothetical protein
MESARAAKLPQVVRVGESHKKSRKRFTNNYSACKERTRQGNFSERVLFFAKGRVHREEGCKPRAAGLIWENLLAMSLRRHHHHYY